MVQIIHGRNSKYYKDRADKLWGLCVKIKAGYQCELSFKQGRFSKTHGLNTNGLNAHHLIERGQLGYRWDLNNGICLSVAVHGSHPNFRYRVYNAHGTDEQRERFKEIVEKMCPEKYEWWVFHKEIKSRTTMFSYEDHYEKLLDIKKELLT